MWLIFQMIVGGLTSILVSNYLLHLSINQNIIQHKLYQLINNYTDGF